MTSNLNDLKFIIYNSSSQAMRHSKSSKQWLNEHFKDTYVKRAQKEGLRARSAYKLKEINDKYQLLKPGMIILDLGAAPGSWSEIAAKLIGKTGKIVAVDILPIKPIDNVKIIQGDFTQTATQNNVLAELKGNLADVVLSDIAPNTSGIGSIDHDLSINLVKTVYNFAIKILKSQGVLLVKVFQGKSLQEMIESLQNNFALVKIIKPTASRARSREIFLLAKELKKGG